MHSSMFLLFCLYIISSFAGHTLKNPTTGVTYDYSKLAGIVIEGSDSNVKTYQYKASIFDDMEDKCDDIMTGDKIAGCTYQFGGEPGGKTVCWDVLAKWMSKPNITDIDVSAGIGKKGVSLHFFNGDNCRELPRQTTMNLICATTPPTQDPFLTGHQDAKDSCHFIINIESVDACPGGGSASNSGGGLSGGWIFIILLIVLPIVYFSSFYAYKGYSSKEWANYEENCPHMGMIRQFPGWVMAGCMISAGTVMGCCLAIKNKIRPGDDDGTTTGGSDGEDY